MGFNYRQERKKFEEQMQENERRFRAAGMSDEQIMAMREYEEEQFRRERVYKIHIASSQQATGPHRRAAPAGAGTSRGQRTSVQPQKHAMGTAGREPRGVASTMRILR